MNKKALLGKLLLLAIIVIAITVGIIFLTGHLNFETKDISIKIEYSPEDSSDNAGENAIIADYSEGNIIPGTERINLENNETNSTI